MEISGQIIDKTTDIFNNDKYLYIINEKEILVELDSVKNIKIKPQFKKIKKETYKLESNEDKIRYIENTQIKNYFVRQFRHLFSLNRYLDKYNNDLPSYNYIINKFYKNDNFKNILILDLEVDFTGNLKDRIITKNSTVFTPFLYDIYNNYKNVNIYTVFSFDKKYKKTVKNKTNTYTILSNNTDLLDKKNFNNIIKQIKNIKFDNIYIDYNIISINYNNKYYNNYFIILLYIILLSSSKKSNLFLKIINNIYNINKNNFIGLSYIYTNNYLLKPIFSNSIQSNFFVLYKNFINNKNILDELNKIIENKKIFNKKYYLENYFILNNINEKKLNNFQNILYNRRLKKIIILSKLLKYFMDNKYKFLFNTIISRIKNIQKTHYIKYKKLTTITK